MTKEEALGKYKQHLKEGRDYLGIASQVLEKLESDALFSLVVSGLCKDAYEMKEDLGWAVGWVPNTFIAQKEYDRKLEVIQKYELAP